MTDREEFEDVEEMVKYLEKEYGIEVLSIRDYGSRAWSLDSEDSDIDAGMVYRQDPMDYVKLGEYQENIDRKFFVGGEDFELIGWNITRFTELLNKSNPSMIEWLNSDITYYEMWTPTVGGRVKELEEPSFFFDDIREHANEEFKPISLFYHYRSLAKSNYTQYIKNKNHPTVKRHLYVLRALTYARYIENTHSMPPLEYTEFYEKHLPEMKNIPVFVKNYIGELIERKKNGNGDQTIVDKELSDWIESELDDKITNDKHDVRGIDEEKLNELIQSVMPISKASYLVR